MGLTTSDNVLRIKGFTVTIDNAGTGKTTDSNWSRISGGANVVEVAEVTVGNEKFKRFAPGHSYVTPIILEGGVTKNRMGMIQWLNDTTAGQNPRRTVTITPIHIDGTTSKNHVYHDCLIEEYTFPDLSSEAHNELKERVVIRPERSEIQ